ncbi:MAG: hypothetical protein RIS47_1387 [Bacteroidota bacterium]|jgi:uncharacterized protein (TIGR02145 family)
MTKFTTLALAVLVLSLWLGACSSTKEEITEPALTDAEGYVYKTVTIGNQVWMAENLRTRKTPQNTDLTGVSVYAGSESYITPCGLLYTHAAAEAACPSGWHLPTDADWIELETHLGMPSSESEAVGYRGVDQSIGGKLKAVDTQWASPNTGATNITGFNAFSSGRKQGASYTNYRLSAYFWTSTASGDLKIYRMLSNDNAGIWRYTESPETGYSVRYVKNK